MPEKDLGIDLIHKEPVGDQMKMWKKMVERREKFGSFSMFYVAGPNDRVEDVVSAFSSELGVDADHTIEFEVDPKQSDVVRNLFQLKDKIQALPGKRVVLLVKGFEQMIKETDPSRYFRAGHDWDQDVVENYDKTVWGKEYSAMGKHVIIITTIGFSAGDSVYDEATRSAVGSHFTSGVIETENRS